MDFLLDDAIFSKNLDAENKLLQEYVKLAREQTDEFAFAIVYFKDGTKKWVPLARGNNGSIEVPDLDSFWFSNSELQKVIYFHTHPLFSENSELRPLSEGEQVTHIAPPSSDDFRMMATRMQEELSYETEERIITPMGIWTYGLEPGITPKSKADELYKLGTLFNSMSSLKNDIDRRLQILKLNKIQPGWGSVANTFDRLMSVPSITKDSSVVAWVLSAAQAFEIAMQNIGYRVTFTPYP